MINKSNRNENFKAKLNLAFFILYYFDPHIFYILKGFPQTDDKNNFYLLEKLKRMKISLNKVSKRLIYQRKFLEVGEYLKMKYFLNICLNIKILKSDNIVRRLKTNQYFYNFFSDVDVKKITKTLQEFLYL